ASLHTRPPATARSWIVPRAALRRIGAAQEGNVAESGAPPAFTSWSRAWHNRRTMNDEPLIRDVSDTARWMAVYRAEETERADAAFRDPYARQLAGARGEAIAKAMTAASEHAWSFTARTYLFDRYVTRLVKHGVDLVVNLAAGLDTRPYRMELPPSLR